MSKVLTAGICSYSAKLRNSLKHPGSHNYKPLHQSTKYNSLGRWRNKVMARDNWYQENQEKDSSSTNTFDTGGWKKGSKKAGKEKPSKIKQTTVLFVPST